MASGKLWAVQADGTEGLGMPQLQFVAGGDFSSALSEVAKAKLAEVGQKLREVGEEIALITPLRNVPLSAQQPVRESGAALLIGGVSSDASSPEVMPLLRAMSGSQSIPVKQTPPLAHTKHKPTTHTLRPTN